jgi:MiaB/RimO family radical SAM methylthiotransferase
LTAIRFPEKAPGSPGAPDPATGRIFLLDPSKRCEPSAYLFTRAVRFFLVNGYGMAKDIDHSQIILVNTCCVTEDKIETSRAALEFARAKGEGKRIVLFGCMAGLPVPGLDREGLICIGPKNLDELDSHFPHHTPVSRISADRLPPALYDPGQGLGRGDYFILIAQGCSNRCSYCNIKRAKGEVRSESAETILRQLRNGLSLGVREFALLADDCASYGRDLGTDLTELMERLFAAGGDYGLKLGYVYPQFLLTHFERLKGVFETGRIRYVNIPVQSGSQRILDLMNRRYAIERVMQAVRQLRTAAPETTFCTHVMINFPTESHDDFLMSLAVADAFDEVLFLHYSDNRGTAAAGLLPKVPEQEVRRRLDLASDYANHCKAGRSAVIKDFNCDTPYNVLEAMKA